MEHTQISQKEVSGIQNFDNTPLLSNHQTISHTPEKFLIDFKGVHPQFTPDNQVTMLISHKVVLMDPHVAKEFLQVLSNNIRLYEEKFGDIQPPKPVTQAKQQQAAKHSTTMTERPSYLG